MEAKRYAEALQYVKAQAPDQAAQTDAELLKGAVAYAEETAGMPGMTRLRHSSEGTRTGVTHTKPRGDETRPGVCIFLGA